MKSCKIAYKFCSAFDRLWKKLIIHVKNDNESQGRGIIFVAPGLLSVPSIGGGGIENNIFNLAKNSQIPSIIISPKPRSKKAQKFKDPHILYSIISETKFYPLPPHFTISNMCNYLKTFFFHIDAAVRFIMNREKIGAVVVFDKFSGIIPLLIAGLFGKKKVYMEYNIWPWTYPESHRHHFFLVQTLFGRLIASICSIVTANSPSIREGMISNGIDSSKIFIIPTGIDNVDFNRRNRQIGNFEEMHVLYAGRLVEERGADLLLEIINIITHYSDKIYFDIVGDGPLKNTLSEVHGSNSSNIKLFGQLERSKVIKLMNKSDICLFISRNENYGSLALLECMAAECPIIATDVGSTSKVVKTGFNGLLVDPDAISIAEAIIMLFTDRSTILKMKTNCRKISAEYNWGVVSAKFAKILGINLWI